MSGQASTKAAPKQVYERASPDEIRLYVPKDEFAISFQDETEDRVTVVVRRRAARQAEGSQE